MTLNQYIKNLQEVVKKKKSNGELPVIYAIDDEGNGHQKIHYKPTLVEVESIDDYHLEIKSDKSKKPNCIIVN